MSDRKRRVPLQFLEESIKNDSFNEKVRDIGDKQFAHLDDNHEVRNDYIRWHFNFNKGTLTPTHPNTSWHKITGFQKGDLLKGISFIESICE